MDGILTEAHDARGKEQQERLLRAASRRCPGFDTAVRPPRTSVPPAKRIVGESAAQPQWRVFSLCFRPQHGFRLGQLPHGHTGTPGLMMPAFSAAIFFNWCRPAGPYGHSRSGQHRHFGHHHVVGSSVRRGPSPPRRNPAHPLKPQHAAAVYAATGAVLPPASSVHLADAARPAPPRQIFCPFARKRSVGEMRCGEVKHPHFSPAAMII